MFVSERILHQALARCCENTEVVFTLKKSRSQDVENTFNKRFMKCFHVHYLIRTSTTELCARQGGRPHGPSERGPPMKEGGGEREMQAARTLRRTSPRWRDREDVLWEVVL